MHQFAHTSDLIEICLRAKEIEIFKNVKSEVNSWIDKVEANYADQELRLIIASRN